jgi:hypothetical protein
LHAPEAVEAPIGKQKAAKRHERAANRQPTDVKKPPCGGFLPEAEEITSSLRQQEQQPEQRLQQPERQPEQRLQPERPEQQQELQQRVRVPEQQLLPSCRKRTEQQQPSEQR